MRHLQEGPGRPLAKVLKHELHGVLPFAARRWDVAHPSVAFPSVRRQDARGAHVQPILGYQPNVIVSVGKRLSELEPVRTAQDDDYHRGVGSKLLDILPHLCVQLGLGLHSFARVGWWSR